VLDTDLGTNVDDALALAYAARHPSIDLRAVVTVSGDSLVRARLAKALLGAAGRDDVVVAAGLPGFADRAWSGHEGEGMPPGWEREDVDLHGWHRMLAGHRGTVVTLGMLSNLAEVMRVGMLVACTELVVMGGLFPPTALLPERDHNLVTDPDSAVVALTAGLPTLLVPIDVTVQTALRPHHLQRLRQAAGLPALLADLIEAWTPRTGHRLVDRVAHLHDPLATACAVDRSFVRIERLPVTVARVGPSVRTFVDPVAGVPTDVVRAVDAEGFADHWLGVVLGEAT
jgi:purine nucleosidase